MSDKICTKCRVPKSKTAFYRNKAYRDGLYSWCKDCMKAAALARERRLRRERGAREQPPIRVNGDGLIECRHCGRRLPPQQMAKQYNRTTKDAPKFQRTCVDCQSARKKKSTGTSERREYWKEAQRKSREKKRNQP